MKTEHKLAEILKTTMSEMPLDEISVTTLTNKCRINRKTFYYHFHDIYDLLTLVFLDEKIDGISEVKNIKDMVKCISRYCLKNANFVDATVSSAGKDLFQEFIYNSCYQSLLRFVNDIPESKNITLGEKKSIARFYSLGISYSIVYYIATHKTKTSEGMLNSFAFISDKTLENAVILLQKE